MDLCVIVGCAIVGVALASAVALNIPDAPLVVKIIIRVSGLVFGAVAGSLFAWIVKQSSLQAKHEEVQAERKKSLPKQIAGNPCHICKSAIIFASDAHICPQCKEIVCVKCEPTVPCTACRSSTENGAV